MRILCLNANTSAHITRTVADAMRAALGTTAEVVEATPSFGPAVIKTRLDHAVASHAIVDAAAQYRDVDAVMLAVSYDTAREALREALSVPVIGMTEASVAMARMTGGRIGYVSLGATTVPLYRETLGHCDLDRDMAGWTVLEAPAAYGTGDRSGVDALVAGGVRELAAKGADVVVLLGAVLAGAATRVQAESPLPVIDGGRAGALMARAMVDLGVPEPDVGSLARRTGTGMTGVSAQLAALQSET